MTIDYYNLSHNKIVEGKIVKDKSLLLFGLSLAVISSVSFAQTKSFPQWGTGITDDKDGFYAATGNDSGGILGQYCLTDQSLCYWILVNSVKCEKDATYPALVNSEAGSDSVAMLCWPMPDGKPRFAFKSFNGIDDLIRKSSNIGIAFPMESGTFKVSRFNVSGANVALDYMRGFAEKAIAKKPSAKSSASTKDVRM